MSIELQEIVAMLQEEKTRYDQLIAISMDNLNNLRNRKMDDSINEDQGEIEETVQRMESEIEMLHSLVETIYFKLRILTLNNHAS
ncbi:hypothetical protein ACQCN2_04715 [Brevibacillus ginsengisoli]|uniref:hypothetical protein n=1 Tax=Brevibacillus ginsengisoli TaxID=363854 RepID=UPI003CEDC975